MRSNIVCLRSSTDFLPAHLVKRMVGIVRSGRALCQLCVQLSDLQTTYAVDAYTQSIKRLVTTEWLCIMLQNCLGGMAQYLC